MPVFTFPCVNDVGILYLRFTFASPPFQVRFKSVPDPFLRMGEKWDLVGICIGITWEVQIT